MSVERSTWEVVRLAVLADVLPGVRAAIAGAATVERRAVRERLGLYSEAPRVQGLAGHPERRRTEER
jgi:hypothetical protein